MINVYNEVERTLKKWGISPKSKFYGYIGHRIEFKYKLAQIRRRVEISPEPYKTMVDNLSFLEEQNNNILNSRYSHYNMLKGAKERIVENMLDYEGKTYMESTLVTNADLKTIIGLSEIEESLKDGQIDEARYISDKILEDLDIIYQKDEALKETSMNREMLKDNKRSKWKSQNGSLKDLRKKVGISVAAIVVAVCGIDYAMTTNTIGKEKAVINNEPQISSSMSIEEQPLINGLDFTEQAAINVIAPDIDTREVITPVVSTPSTIEQYNAIIESRNQRAVGMFEASVAQMDDSLISVLADAVREGDKYVPNTLGNNSIISMRRIIR